MAESSEQKILIDVHQHIVPEVFRSLLNSVGITGGAGEELAPWDEQTTLATMDEYGIQTSVVSYVLSGIDIDDFDFFRRLCRDCNTYTAELIAKYPGRFGGFALIPLPDVDGTLEEIAYALDELKLDGIGMHSNMGGVYPGDERFDPVFEELNRRKAVVHLHPTDIPERKERSLMWPPYIVEFMFETTRAAANLVYMGTMERYPDVSIILSHAGGAVPYLAWRMWTGEFTVPSLSEAAPSGVYESLKQFYYDTGMASNPGTFGSLMELVGPERIVFGTDYPYMPDFAIGEFVRHIDEYPAFDAGMKREIKRDNALRLFPRLA
jgi:predicted TIM-barrel fold metal-dependent hydrolase